jgi:sugar lactone lactonase YvrE
MKNKIKVWIVLISISFLFVNKLFSATASSTIEIIAGTGDAGWSGDGGLAVNAKLYTPMGVTVDSLGNVFIADRWSCIRKIDQSGVITTIAGQGYDNTNGYYGFEGDGGPSTSSKLNCPLKIAIDSASNIYIADSENACIRKIDGSGNITTIAGRGISSYDNILATQALLGMIKGVAVDKNGNVYISDNGYDRIMKVDINGVITKIAPATIFNSPRGLAVDSIGNLYIADTWNNRVQKIDTTGIITTVAGNGVAGYSGDNGLATLAQLNAPDDVTVDSLGNLYIADTLNYCIRKVNLSGTITTVWSNLPGLVNGIAVDRNNYVYLAFSDLHRVGRFSLQSSQQTGSFSLGNNMIDLQILLPAKIMFHLDQTQNVKLSVYDLRYRLVKDLADKTFVPGDWQIYWDGSDNDNEKVGPGVYLVNMRSNDIRGTKKIFVMR